MNLARLPQEQLDAARAAVRAEPGITAAGVARALGVPRGRALVLLRALEESEQVARRTGQASVEWHLAGEAPDAG